MTILFLLYLFFIGVCRISPTKALTMYVAIKLCSPPSIRFFFISFNTLLFVSFLLICFPKIIKEYKTIDKQQKIVILPLLFFWLSLLFVGVISFIIVGEVPLMFQLSQLFQFFLTDILPAIIIVLFIKTKSQTDSIIRFFLYASFFTCLYGILTFIISDNPLFVHFNNSDIEYLEIAEQGRGNIESKAVGVYNNSIVLSIISFLIFIFFYRKENVKPILRVSILICSFVTLFLTLQRSALVGLCIFFIYVFWHNRKIISKYILQMSFLFVIFFYFLLEMDFLDVILEHFQGITSILDTDSSDYSGSSINMRIDQFTNIINYVKDFFMFGLGYGFPTYLKEITDGSIDDRFYGFESLIFTVFISSGLFGIFIWYRLFLSYIKNLRNQLSKNVRFYYVAFVVSYVCVAIFTNLAGTLYLFLILCNLNIAYKNYYEIERI